MRIYDAYAEAFQVIHANLAEALEAANVTGPSGTLNRQAKAAARSAFESNKQRFFNHLITAMKVPTLIGAIERDLAEGAACVVQLVSTGEALLDRRLAEIPAGEWADVQVDITPREYVLDYLAHGFPTQLFEVFTDTEGNLHSRPVFRDGQPVQSREAVERRDRMIEHLAALPAVQGALDQIVQRFGTDQVAEVTGRSRRVVRKVAADGTERLAVETRPGSANLAETQAFMDDEKRILVFSDAGGTGRSYHADLGRAEPAPAGALPAGTRLEGRCRDPGTSAAPTAPISASRRCSVRWRPTCAARSASFPPSPAGSTASARSPAASARPAVRACSAPTTIWRATYARAALRQFYGLIFAGKVECCSLQRFEETTGLDLSDRDGSLREDLPPITTFLNRMLALPIALQNGLFAVFEELLASRIESAIAAGSYDVGVETLTADSLRIAERRTIHTHAASGAETRLFKVMRRDRNRPLPAGDALALARDPRARLLVNDQSGRAAVQMPAPSLTLDDGEVQRRVRLVRPMARETIALDALDRTHWTEADAERFAATWNAEVAQVPEFTESAFHIVTGLLLPIWNRLPDESLRVYRLQTDDGERVIGRLISPAAMGEVCRALGLDDAPTLSPDEAWSAVLADGAVLHLAGGLTIRRAMVMGAARVELVGFTDGAVDQLKAMGLTSEIIAWRLRLFIPVSRPRTRDPGGAVRAIAAHPRRRSRRGLNVEMLHVRVRRRTGAPPRARGRGGVPPLPLQRPPPGPLLAGRRRPEQPGPQPVRAADRARRRPRRRRQMDRRRDRPAWRSARPDPAQPRSRPPGRCAGRGTGLPRTAASRSCRAHRHEQDRRTPPGGCSPCHARSSGRWPRPISATGASPRGWRSCRRSAFTPPASTGRMTLRPASPGRR